MSATSQTGAELSATSRYGSPELVKTQIERGALFRPFNDAFVRMYVKRPTVDVAGIRDPLNRFFAEGGAEYQSPTLIGKPHYDQAVAEIGYDPIAQQAA